MPNHSTNSATSTASTKQHVHRLPPLEDQHIVWLAEVLSCKSLTDVDERGWNIVHHLFQCIVQSVLAFNIVRNMCDRGKPMLNGSMGRAMLQKTTGQDPHGWTPVQFLCHNSDTDFRKNELIVALLDSGRLLIADFDVTDDKVLSFF